MAAASAAIADLSRYSKPPPLGGGVFTENLMLERQQVAAYTTFVRELGERDPTTRRLLLGILAETERHASELADYLKNTTDVRP